MSKMFLDPERALFTCEYKNCNNCNVSGNLNCHFNIKQLIKFMTIVLPSSIIAGFVIFKFNPFYLLPWFLLFIIFFGFVEIRVMCSHCPHYAEPDIKSLKCWANYGSPKLWKYRPGPMSLNEKIIFFAGFIVIFIIYPFIFFILKNSYIFLGLYILFVIIGILALKKYYCSICINFACPLNNVDEEMKNKFFDKNPSIKKAWKK